MYVYCRFCFCKQDRPNIVWLTTEDNSANWYRFYNPESGAAMPNIERLAKDGIVFNNAYSCGPVCSVARSTIISGCYVPRLGAQWHRKQVPVHMPGDLHILSATVLNLAGIKVPEEIDGKPFLGKGVTLDELNKRHTAFGYAERFDEKYDMVRFLRKGKPFGEKNKDQIAALVDIADLQMVPFPEARERIAKVPASRQPMERYWL